LLKSWPPGSGGATIGETVFNVLIKGTYLKDLLPKNQWAQRAEISAKSGRIKTISSAFLSGLFNSIEFVSVLR
jgi:hypothetical protein